MQATEFGKLQWRRNGRRDLVIGCASLVALVRTAPHEIAAPQLARVRMFNQEKGDQQSQYEDFVYNLAAIFKSPM